MSFTPSQYELALVTQIFAKADPQKLRILTVDAARKVFAGARFSRAQGFRGRKVFAGARLPPVVLSEILSLVDEHNDDVLPQSRVAIVVRLLGWAQIGEQVTKALVSKRERTRILASSIHC
jgi:epidermal growth factor receptor substrate 15